MIKTYKKIDIELKELEERFILDRKFSKSFFKEDKKRSKEDVSSPPETTFIE